LAARRWLSSSCVKPLIEISLFLEVCPFRIVKSPLLKPSFWARKAINSLLARPLTGGAATFTRSTPSEKPASSLLAALGCTRNRSLTPLSARATTIVCYRPVRMPGLLFAAADSHAMVARNRMAASTNQNI
jgi:hypothetical protein